jgi:hypothetical protein
MNMKKSRNKYITPNINRTNFDLNAYMTGWFWNIPKLNKE